MNSLLSWTKSVCVVAVATKADDAIEKLPVFVDRAANIECALKALKRAKAAYDFVLRRWRSAAC